MTRLYKREHRGVSAHSKLVSFMNESGKSRTCYVVTKDGLPEYKSSAALTHKEAVQDAVNFWMKNNLIPKAY